MSRTARVVLLLTSIRFACVGQEDASEVYRRARDAVVLIRGEKGFGSGFLISPNGFVVTNHHVVAGESRVVVAFADGSELSVGEVVAYDPQLDLVILAASGTRMPYVELGDSDRLSVGERIYVVSNPAGLERSITEGLISGTRHIDGKDLLQISAPISAGSSGGPVLDRNAQVVGVATATLSGAQNANFAIPVSAIHELIAGYILRGRHATRLSDLIRQNRPTEESEDEVAALLARVKKYIENEMIDEAEGLLRSGTREHEFDANIRIEFAKVLIREFRYSEAVTQLRIARKLDPDRRDSERLLAHLNLKRWLLSEDPTGREFACKSYNRLIQTSTTESEKRELQRYVDELSNPVGKWQTIDTKRQFTVFRETESAQPVAFSMNLDERAPWPKDWDLAVKEFASTHANAPIDSTFHFSGDPGVMVGTTKFLDFSCTYEGSIRVEVRNCGSELTTTAMITRVAGVLIGAIDVFGKKRARSLCRNAGEQGFSLSLVRVPQPDMLLDLTIAVEIGAHFPFAQK